ncbi:epoxide hydrolase family protein [Mangrovimicrobium sediminis]|uniref:epoxide hydrolase family protein n=1 Tax=Mangrovimicrobium sediminis TaxID=2562682 RepID=UPI001436B4CC|nr:epoxide hydrolase family protein [Haliea sp. SAOS-164]
MSADAGSGLLPAGDPRPFTIRVADAALDDLQRRLAATRWLRDPFQGSWDFGTPQPFLRALCQRWQSQFDWRAVEDAVNTHPQCLLPVDGIEIHALHQRSDDPQALPVLLLHGWPGSFLDFSRLWSPLAAPPTGQPAFHVVAPSLPGYGFSSTRPGVNAQRMAAQFTALMARLGYPRFLVHGGNWGSLIGTEIARQFPQRVLGLHLTSVSGSAPSTDGDFPVSEEERSWLVDHAAFPHFALLSRTPVSAAHALNDSPAGLAAWLGEKLHDWADRTRGDCALDEQRMLETIALYWFTGTIATSMNLYRELVTAPPRERYVDCPTAVSVFPASVAKLPRSWTERLYRVTQWSVHQRGGHFHALEVPELVLAALRRFAAGLGAA